MERNNPSREKSLDEISGVAILWLSLTHALQIFKWEQTPLYTFGLQTLFFAVPWFYFKAGLFVRTNTTLSEFVRGKVRSVLVPLLIWFVFGYFIRAVTVLPSLDWPIWKIILHPIYAFAKQGEIVGNPPIWFLWSLFTVQVLGYFIKKQKSQWKTAIWFVMLLLEFIVMPYSGYIPMGFTPLLLGLLIYLAPDVFQWIEKRNLWLLLGLVILVAWQFPAFIDVRTNRLEMGNSFVFLLNSILASFCLRKIGLPLPMLNVVGRYSMAILAVHYPMLLLVKACIPNGLSFLFTIITWVATVLFAILLAERIRKKWPQLRIV